MMDIKEILKLECGTYTGMNSDGENIIVVRNQEGFTIKTDEGKKCLWCVDYDEDGNIECSYPEY